MTLYTKPRAEIFAQNAPDSEIRPFTAWLRGLGIAFDESGGLPEMESFNGLLQALNSYIKYLEQNGFAEWSADLEYPVGAGVRVGAVWYRAKTQNTNKPPATSQSEWVVFLNAVDLTFSDPIQISNGAVSILDATTSIRGVARMATSEEVANRSNVTAFVKPSDIPQPSGIPNASTTIIGVSRFANANEINNKSNATVSINPANVATIIGNSFSRNTQSRTSADGFIMKWGVVYVNSDSNSTVDFLDPFPTACINAQATLNSIGFSVTQDAGCGIVWDKTSVTVRNGSSFGLSVSWFAIGY